jgi:hypothetical protein
MRSGVTPPISRWISSLALAATLAICAAAPAQAAFPGTPGPLVYPRQIITGEDLGGLVIHGPRQRQKPHRLTNSGSDDTPSFSADGRSIVFSGNRTYGINIFVAESNGRHIRQLTHNHRDCFSGGCNLSPAWAPDGKHIAFLSVGRFSSDLEVMRSDGSGTKEFANGSTEEEGLGTAIGPPAWGPVRP